MRVSTLITAACSALAVALPSADISVAPRSLPGLSDLIHSASSILGWELVAATNTTAQLKAVCDAFDSFKARFGAVGLNTMDIKAPICISSTAFQQPTSTDLMMKIYQYNTDIFITQLLNSFDMTTTTSTEIGYLDPLAYLCQYALSYEALRHFSIIPDRVFQAVCDAAGLPVRSEGNEQISENNPAFYDFFDAVSDLLGYEIATAASTVDDLNTLCSSHQGYWGHTAQIGLHPARIEAVICGIKQPLQPLVSINFIESTSTRAFSLILQNADKNIVDWNIWLCTHISTSAMDNIGLIGKQVQDNVC